MAVQLFVVSSPRAAVRMVTAAAASEICRIRAGLDLEGCEVPDRATSRIKPRARVNPWRGDPIFQYQRSSAQPSTAQLLRGPFGSSQHQHPAREINARLALRALRRMSPIYRRSNRLFLIAESAPAER